MRVVLAGGGSAGHTSPLIATADWLRTLDPGIELTAVGTATGLEVTVVPAAGLRLELIPRVPLPRRITPAMLAVPGHLAGAVRQARELLTAARADVVVGFGGYVAMPVYLAARGLRIPIVVHEQNALPGLANKVAARTLTRHVGTSFPDTPLPHARYVGLPLRTAIEKFDRAALRPDAWAAFGLEPDRPTLLVSGGSLGALSINAALVGARDRLLATGIQILHVVGNGKSTEDTVPVSHPQTGARYRPMAYVDRMEQAYAVADLMLARSGAGTVCETAAVGLPCMFVPLAVGNGEQARNARPVVDADAGVLVSDHDCTADLLARRMPELLGDPDRLAQMGRAAQRVIPRDGAEKLARWIVAVAG